MERAPRKRDREASKQAFMQAGLRVFSEHGYDAATTKAIAAEAGLNEQLITRYFGGKAGLLLEILASFVDQERDGANHPPAAATVEEEILQFLRHRNGRLLELQDFFRAFLPMSLHDGSIRDRLRPILLRESSVLRDCLAALQERGSIRRDADVEAASMIVGGLSFHISFLMRVNLDLSDEYFERIVSEFGRDMAAGLAAARP